MEKGRQMSKNEEDAFLTLAKELTKDDRTFVMKIMKTLQLLKDKTHEDNKQSSRLSSPSL